MCAVRFERLRNPICQISSITNVLQVRYCFQFLNVYLCYNRIANLFINCKRLFILNPLKTKISRPVLSPVKWFGVEILMEKQP